MDCSEVKVYLLSALENGRPDALPADLQAHLKTCSICREEHLLLDEGHRAIVGSLPFLAPDRSYLTPQRLAELQEAVDETSAGILSAGRRMKPAYYAAAAAVLILISGFLFLISATGRMDTEPEPGGTTAVLPQDESERADAAQADFRLIVDPETSILVTADLSDVADFKQLEGGRRPGNLLPVSAGGLSIPVQDTVVHFRQDDYWW